MLTAPIRFFDLFPGAATLRNIVRETLRVDQLQMNNQAILKRIIMKLLPASLITIFMTGCYSSGRSHFLSYGEPEYFLTMNGCEEEAKSRHQDGSSKYSGYECRYQFLFFTLSKIDFYEGKIQSSPE